MKDTVRIAINIATILVFIAVVLIVDSNINDPTLINAIIILFLIITLILVNKQYILTKIFNKYSDSWNQDNHFSQKTLNKKFSNVVFSILLAIFIIIALITLVISLLLESLGFLIGHLTTLGIFGIIIIVIAYLIFLFLPLKFLDEFMEYIGAFNQYKSKYFVVFTICTSTLVLIIGLFFMSQYLTKDSFIEQKWELRDGTEFILNCGIPTTPIIGGRPTSCKFTSGKNLTHENFTIEQFLDDSQKISTNYDDLEHVTFSKHTTAANISFALYTDTNETAQSYSKIFNLHVFDTASINFFLGWILALLAFVIIVLPKALRDLKHIWDE